MLCFKLELQGMHIEEGTNSEADSEFLMELMEINETLAEAQTLEGAEKIGRDTKGKRMRPFSLLTESLGKRSEVTWL